MFAILAVALAAAQPLAAQAIVPDCGQSDDTGLGWGLCNVPELKQLVESIEDRQRDLARKLGPSAGKALSDAWGRLLANQRREVGTKWLDIAAADVAVALGDHLSFLATIDTGRRARLGGLWGNGRGELRIAPDGSNALQAEDCQVHSGDLTIRREGSVVRLKLNKTAYAFAGCEAKAGAIDGLYLPLLSR
jgi:hypothetical protein